MASARIVRQEGGIHLLVKVKDEDDDPQKEDRSSEGYSNPRDPVPRMEVQLLTPARRIQSPLGLVGIEDDLRVGNEAFDIDEVFGLATRGTYEEVLDVIVRTAESEVAVRRPESKVGRLR